MANVLNRNTLEFKRSVNTPDFNPAIWIINPDMSLTEGVESKYWVVTDDTVSVMSAVEMLEKDSVITEITKDAVVDSVTSALGPLLPTFVDMTNQTRAQTGLTAITMTDVKAIARGKL